jgi:hypothetical protein
VESVDRNHNALYAVIGTSSPCGKIRRKSSTVYPQQKAVFKPIHILEKFESLACIWGYGFKEISDLNGTSPQGWALIHR